MRRLWATSAAPVQLFNPSAKLQCGFSQPVFGF
jgi:hypothetical protein